MGSIQTNSGTKLSSADMLQCLNMDLCIVGFRNHWMHVLHTMYRDAKTGLLIYIFANLSTRKYS